MPTLTVTPEEFQRLMRSAHGPDAEMLLAHVAALKARLNKLEAREKQNEFDLRIKRLEEVLLKGNDRDAALKAIVGEWLVSNQNLLADALVRWAMQAVEPPLDIMDPDFEAKAKRQVENR